MQTDSCRFCGSTNLGAGYQMGNAQLYPDLYAYHSASSGSVVEHVFCKDCGRILFSRVQTPALFPQYGAARQEALLDDLDRHGILLCNESPELPSLCGLGYSMENIIGLIEQKKAFYCKAYQKRSTYLSVQAYQHLNRCRAKRPLSEQARTILRAMAGKPAVDKEELRASLQLEKKEFDRAFDRLLEDLFITAIGGKRLNPNWYGYLYCTCEVWMQGVPGLHFMGDSRAVLRALFGPSMPEKAFSALCGKEGI